MRRARASRDAHAICGVTIQFWAASSGHPFRRLVHKDVKPRSGDAATIQRLGKGSFVHNCAARRIDKERSGLHQVKALRIHKPAGLVRERAMQRDDIGF